MDDVIDHFPSSDFQAGKLWFPESSGLVRATGGSHGFVDRENIWYEINIGSLK